MGRITRNLRGDDKLFGSMMKSPLFASHNFQCTVLLNQTVEKWMETIPEDKQKRVRHIQNEVSTKCFFFLFQLSSNLVAIFEEQIKKK